MQGISGAAFMLLQYGTGQLTQDVHLIMIYVAIASISILVLVFFLLVAGIVAAALVVRTIHSAEKLKKRAGPIVDKANGLVAEFTPKVRSVVDTVEHISTVARNKVDEVGDTVSKINQTVQETNQRTRAQVERVDGMVTHTLTATQEIADTVERGVRKPVRQVAGIVAALRVGLETWIARSPFGAVAGTRTRARAGAPPAAATEPPPAYTPPADSGRPYDV